jgi:hypothetical protein
LNLTGPTVWKYFIPSNLFTKLWFLFCHCNEQIQWNPVSICAVCWIGSELVKTSVLWEVIPCSLFSVNKHFWRNISPPSSKSKSKANRNQYEADIRHSLYRSAVFCRQCSLLRAGFSLFNPEDGGDMFLWNVSSHSLVYMVLYPRGWNSS